MAIKHFSMLNAILVISQLFITTPSCHSPSSSPQQQEHTLHTRTYFYIGGRQVNVLTPSYGTGTVTTEQIYIEQLTPVTVTHPYPLIFWTGLGQTATNWLNTPDGRPDWSSYFLSRGYTIYLADQPIRGRSPFTPSPYNDTDISQGVITQSYASQFWTGTQYVTNPAWPQAKLHTQWPGTGLPGDQSFESFVAALVPSLLNQTRAEELSRSALGALLKRVGPATLITHSAGGPHGWAVADDQPELVKAIVALEPQGPPFVNEVISSSGPGIVRTYGITQTPLAYSPPIVTAEDLSTLNVSSGVSDGSKSACILQTTPARRLVNLAKVPVMIVTSEAGYHAVYDYCTVEYLRQAGVRVEWLDLPGVGIRGNGHFMFLERNSLEIAERIERWIP